MKPNKPDKIITLEEGWAWLSNAKKWHYFRNGKSLCGRWLYLGSNIETGNNSSPDNCKKCRDILLKQLSQDDQDP